MVASTDGNVNTQAQIYRRARTYLLRHRRAVFDQQILQAADIIRRLCLWKKNRISATLSCCAHVLFEPLTVDAIDPAPQLTAMQWVAHKRQRVTGIQGADGTATTKMAALA